MRNDEKNIINLSVKIDHIENLMVDVMTSEFERTLSDDSRNDSDEQYKIELQYGDDKEYSEIQKEYSDIKKEKQHTPGMMGGTPSPEEQSYWVNFGHFPNYWYSDSESYKTNDVPISEIKDDSLDSNEYTDSSDSLNESPIKLIDLPEVENMDNFDDEELDEDDPKSRWREHLKDIKKII